MLNIHRNEVEQNTDVFYQLDPKIQQSSTWFYLNDNESLVINATPVFMEKKIRSNNLIVKAVLLQLINSYSTIVQA